MIKEIKRNYKLNWFWFWSAIMTFDLAFFTYSQREILHSTPNWLSFVSALNGKLALTIIIITSILGVLISLFDIKKFDLKYIYVCFLTTIWLFFLITFLQVDLKFHQISIGAGLTMFFIVMIYHFARMGE